MTFTTVKISDPGETLLRLIDLSIAGIRTVAPAKVLAYNPEKNTCNVQPLLKQIVVNSDGTETEESQPEIDEVPIWYPRGAGFRFTWPLKKGDIVVLLFVERSIDQWSQVGGEIRPEPARRFDISDAIAFPGLSPVVSAIKDLNTTDMVVGAEDGSVELRLNASTKTVSIKADSIEFGSDGKAVAREGDSIVIDDPAFLAWTKLITPLGGGPFTGSSITGKITSGSSKVKAE